MAIKHNQTLVKNHFRKDWQRQVIAALPYVWLVEAKILTVCATGECDATSTRYVYADTIDDAARDDIVMRWILTCVLEQ